MEAAGLALGVVGLAGLFNSCLDSLSKFQTYKSSNTDTHILDTRFRAARARFEQWGVNVGISQGRLLPHHHSGLDNKETERVIEDILHIIIKAICDDSSLHRNSGDTQLQNGPGPSAGITQSRRQRLKWAIGGGKEDRVEQVDMFEKLVQQLFNLIPPSGTQHEPISQTWVQDIRKGLDNIETGIKAEVRRDVLSWLGKSPPNDKFEDSKDLRVDKTCDWIFDRPAFQSWLLQEDISKPSLLWLHGPAGFGKTILCAHVIQHLSKTLTTPLAYFFLTSDHETQKNPFRALRSWIYQVVESEAQAFDCVRETWETDSSTEASRRTLISLLKAIVSVLPGCVFIADGLDECSQLGSGDESVSRFLSDIIAAVSDANVKFLFVSRDEPEIREALENNAEDYLSEYRIEASDVKADTAAFSQSVVETKLSNKSEDIRTAISEAMTTRCQGQFLWIKMQEASLRKGMSKKRLNEVVQNTPAGLDRLYDHNWERIMKMSDWERDRVFALLRWAAFTPNPLTVYEITEAVLITQFENLDPEEYPDEIDDDYIKTEIVGLCSPLLDVKENPKISSPGYRTVHVPHFSVRQYLIKHLPAPAWIHLNSELQITQPMMNATAMSKACLQYLSLPQVWEEGYDPDTRTESFRHYAASSWTAHAKLGFLEPSFFELSKDFLKDSNPQYKSMVEYVNKDRVARGLIQAGSEVVYLPHEYVMVSNWQDMAEYLLEHVDVNDAGSRLWTPLTCACLFGTPDMVRKLIKRGANLETAVGEGWKPLHAASYAGRKEVVEILLESGASLNSTVKSGWTPLHAAVSAKENDIVKMLLASGAMLNTTDENGWTPLKSAAYEGKEEILKILLESEADLSLRTAMANKLMQFAAGYGNIKSCKYLIDRCPLECGVAPSVFVPDDRGWLPVALAASGGHVEVTRLLMDLGGEDTLSRTTETGHTLLHGMCSLNGSKNDEIIQLCLCPGIEPSMLAKDYNGKTPLHFAAWNGCLKIAKAILQYRAPNVQALVEARNNDLETPLFNASAEGHWEFVEELLKYGGQTTIPLTDRWNNTPLRAASQLGHVEVVETLLDHGAEVTMAVVNQAGETPLFAASKNGHVEVIKQLFEHGAETTISILDTYNTSPLSAATKGSHPETVDRLLHYGAGETIAVPNKSGETALYVAARRNSIEILKLLLEVPGVPVNQGNHHGCTPLFIASRFGCQETVELLLSISSTDIECQDWVGSTALFAAVANGHLEVAKLLLSKGATIPSQAAIGQSLTWWARRSGNSELAELLEAQKATVDGPTVGAHISFERLPETAETVVFDSSLGWCDICTLCVAGGEGHCCKESEECDGVLVCSECFDRGFRQCRKSHTFVAKKPEKNSD